MLRDINRFVREAGGKAEVARAANACGIVMDGRVLLDLTDDEATRLHSAVFPHTESAEDRAFNDSIPF